MWLLRCIVPTAAIGALLAFAAMAVADTPAITSLTWTPSNAGYSYNGVLAVHWTLPADVGCTDAVVVGHSAAVDSNGELVDRSGGGQAVGECVSPDSTNVYAKLTKGTWYVQVIGDDTYPPPCTLDAPCYSYSTPVAFKVGSGTTTVTPPPTSSCQSTASCQIPLSLHVGSGCVETKGLKCKPLNEVTSIDDGDTIKSTGKGRLRFTDDGEELDFGPGTTLQVKRKGLIEILKGEVFYIPATLGWTLFGGLYEVWPGPASKPPTISYSLRPAAAAADRPVVTVEMIGNAARVSVYRGTADLRNRKGKRKRTVTVRAGFRSTVRPGAAPTTPARFAPPAHPFWWP